MGFLKSLFGTGKRQEPYVDAGMALTHKLVTALGLPGWKDLLPVYTQKEVEAINRELSMFQNIANKELGGEARFHPDIVPVLQRTHAAEALMGVATSWRYSDELPTNWREYAATYLKAWAGNLSPLALLGLGELLVAAGYPSEAKDAFGVVLLLPTYEGYSGKEEPGLVEGMVSSAKEALQDLG
jgi:hypothetical protein